MKTLVKCMIVLSLLFSISCRDAKKEAAELEANIEADVEQIESIETATATIEKEIEDDAKALEDALNDLDI